MSDKKEKINGTVQEPEIFGRSKTAEEIKAERRAEKKARQEAAKASRKAMREAQRQQPKGDRKDILVIVGILVLVVVLCVVALAVQFAQDKKRESFERDDTRTSYFLDEDATPEMSEEGIKAVVTAAYYTKGGHLCVEMLLSNGTSVDRNLDSITVEILNGETDEMIASGYTDQVSDSYIVPTGGTNEYTLYIAPEHVVITDDTLETITYTISTSAVEVE